MDALVCNEEVGRQHLLVMRGENPKGENRQLVVLCPLKFDQICLYLGLMVHAYDSCIQRLRKEHSQKFETSLVI